MDQSRLGNDIRGRNSAHLRGLQAADRTSRFDYRIAIAATAAIRIAMLPFLGRLGARIESVDARSVAVVLTSVVRRENAGIVVIGHRPMTWWRQVTGRSFVDRLLPALKNDDIYVVERSK